MVEWLVLFKLCSEATSASHHILLAKESHGPSLSVIQSSSTGTLAAGAIEEQQTFCIIVQSTPVLPIGHRYLFPCFFAK